MAADPGGERVHPYDPDEALVLAAAGALDLPRLESVKYLLDWLIEGGYAEDAEDERHLNAVHGWLVEAGLSGRTHESSADG
jgi:hypothetical protein